MSTKIGLLSDVHATTGPLVEALKLFEAEGVDRVLCTGDIAGYGTELTESVDILVDKGCITILGNHDVWFLNRHAGKMAKRVEAFFQETAATWEATVEGKRIFAVHASPPDSMNRGITLLDQHEKIIFDNKEQWRIELEAYDFDVVVVGHTHQVFAELLGKTLVINPGSTAFNHTCAILTLPEMDVKIFPLSGKEIRKVWHWGMMK